MKKATRFAKTDRVRCNLGEELGWVYGVVQAVDEPDEECVSIPYVVRFTDHQLSESGVPCLKCTTRKTSQLLLHEVPSGNLYGKKRRAQINM